MKVIADTSIWSLALRRSVVQDSEPVKEFLGLIRDHRIYLIGAIRQEVLSGIRDESQFESLRRHLETFPDLPILPTDYIAAARFFNTCRAKGVQGSNTDFLLSAVAVRSEFAIFTTDRDFLMFASHLPIVLHRKELLVG